ncbi:hypothetical protein ALP66_100680 [Pseudomonas amygdali pv. photiniae]|uniref:Uncharacterized protein n=3 Tax=Pseudomonas syringae group TaxID=136849 RepID=A0A0P9TB04_PSEA0|nr:hypothetical protein ALO53_100647 [Pseudomonas amygdali pv. photiniae]RMS40596.1 hypothetical protein ALP66_100680 [Pseudomonas amygdali pv. photiniae]
MMTVCFVRGRSESDQSLRLDPHRPGLNLTTDFHRLATRQSALSVTQLAEQQKKLSGPVGLFAKLCRQVRSHGRQAPLIEEVERLEGRKRKWLAEQAVQFILGLHGRRPAVDNPFKGLLREDLCCIVFDDASLHTLVERYTAGEALRHQDSEYFVKLIATTRNTVERRIVFHGLLEHFDRLLPIEKSIYPLNYRTTQLAHLEQEETLYGKLIMEQPISTLLEVHTPAWLLENLSFFEFSID